MTQTSPNQSGGPPLRALAMVLIALAIVFAGLGARELFKSDSGDSAAVVETTSAAAETTTTTTPASTATLDKSTPITVYNNGQIQGLAATVAEKLTAEGWTVGEVGNYSESNIAENTVFYDADDSEQKQVATALATELDAAVTEKSTATASLGDGVIVVVVTE